MNCEMADGGVVSFKGIAWLVVLVEGVSRVIAATVVDSVPGYSLLLGRHWMGLVSLKGDYENNAYTIRTEARERVLVRKTLGPSERGGGRDIKEITKLRMVGAQQAS